MSFYSPDTQSNSLPFYTLKPIPRGHLTITWVCISGFCGTFILKFASNMKREDFAFVVQSWRKRKWFIWGQGEKPSRWLPVSQFVFPSRGNNLSWCQLGRMWTSDVKTSKQDRCPFLTDYIPFSEMFLKLYLVKWLSTISIIWFWDVAQIFKDRVESNHELFLVGFLSCRYLT